MRRDADRKLDTEHRRWPRAGSVSRRDADGSVTSLHPTKGWRRTCAKRVFLRIEQARLQLLALQAQWTN